MSAPLHLTPDQIATLRRMREAGETYRAIAREIGIAQVSVMRQLDLLKRNGTPVVMSVRPPVPVVSTRSAFGPLALDAFHLVTVAAISDAQARWTGRRPQMSDLLPA